MRKNHGWVQTHFYLMPRYSYCIHWDCNSPLKLLLAGCKPPTKTRDPKDCKATTNVRYETKARNRPYLTLCDRRRGRRIPSSTARNTTVKNQKLHEPKYK